MAVPAPACPGPRLDLHRRSPLVGAAIALGVAVGAASCRVAPEPLPPWPVDDEPLIAGAWKPAAGARPADGGAPPAPPALAALDAGLWTAEVRPQDAGRIPDVEVTLEPRLAEGRPAGTASYDFGGYVCRYALRIDAVEGRTIRLRQRHETGPCGSAGPILLRWDEEDDLVGEWRTSGGTRWFRVRLARLDLEPRDQPASDPDPSGAAPRERRPKS